MQSFRFGIFFLPPLFYSIRLGCGVPGTRENCDFQRDNNGSTFAPHDDDVCSGGRIREIANTYSKKPKHPQPTHHKENGSHFAYYCVIALGTPTH